MLKDMTIEEFLNETASDSPAPGGGSVSALVGALGAALSSMVGELSVGKDSDDDTIIEIKNYVGECRRIMQLLKESIDKDTDAFNAVMAAFRMPKDTDEQKSIRSKEIQSAFKNAADVPYNTAELCLRVMDIAVEMLDKGNKNAASDAAVSGLLGYAALNGALYNVKINLNSIKDEQYVQQMKEKVDKLVLKGEELLSTIKVMSQQAKRTLSKV
jgi:formiminotetrahydrofolate cyclodeaminase